MCAGPASVHQPDPWFLLSCVVWAHLACFPSQKLTDWLAFMPAALFVWFVALLIPFFGVINDIMGAFAVTFEAYIIPCLAFNLYFQGRPDRQDRSLSFRPAR
eukprot:GHRR01024124.1.p3 GENE.GHRR01024124.1~~GHRR01024124.1.p3  ORF type:complete len:102 (+),score=16.70 GHRR01024124.1:592-897(+)